MADVVIKGLKETIDALGKLATDIPAREMKSAAAKALIVMGQAVLERTPQDTGELSRSLTGDVEVYTGSSVVGGYGVHGWVGFTGLMAARALWLEYGHRIVVRDRVVGQAEPKPFMRPALDASAVSAFEAFAAEMVTGLSTRQPAATVEFGALIVDEEPALIE